MGDEKGILTAAIFETPPDVDRERVYKLKYIQATEQNRTREFQRVSVTGVG